MSYAKRKHIFVNLIIFNDDSVSSYIQRNYSINEMIQFRNFVSRRFSEFIIKNYNFLIIVVIELRTTPTKSTRIFRVQSSPNMGCC